MQCCHKNDFSGLVEWKQGFQNTPFEKSPFGKRDCPTGLTVSSGNSEWTNSSQKANHTLALDVFQVKV
mgnify:CR=1 FL=1